jgi:hypothetical protein
LQVKLVDSSRSCCFACNWNLNKPCALSPKHRMAAKNGSRLSVQNHLGSEPPQYDRAEQQPHQYIQQLLQWGAPPGASLEGCVTPPTADGQPAAVDLAALHAAGCFPHAWQVPLTAAGVQAANRRMAAQYAADPAGLLQKAMQKGLHGARKHTLMAAEALNRRAVEADSSSSDELSISGEEGEEEEGQPEEEANSLEAPSQVPKRRRKAADQQTARVPTAGLLPMPRVGPSASSHRSHNVFRCLLRLIPDFRSGFACALALMFLRECATTL